MVLHLGLIGWLLAGFVGFVLGGAFFMSIKWQSEYVIKQRGPEWLIPAALFARMVLLAVVLVLVAVLLPREKLGAAVIAGAIGSMVARVLVSRMVRRQGDADADGDGAAHSAGSSPNGETRE